MSLFLEILAVVAVGVVTIVGFVILLWTALDEAEEGRHWLMAIWVAALIMVIAIVVTLIVVNVSVSEVPL